MTRVYLDSNIFRYLKDVEKLDLFEKLISSKDELIYYYSFAHLSDLSRDKSEKKFEDLLFMEQIVDKNFLNLYPDEKFVNCQIATPSEAYNSSDFSPINEVLNFPKLFEEMKIREDDSPEVKLAKENFETLLHAPLESLGYPNLTDIIGDDNPVKKLLPKLPENGTLRDLIQGMLNSFNDLIEDPSIWREFRSFSIQYLGLQKFDLVINSVDFNNLLKDTPIQKTFLEFVEDTFKHNKDLEKQRQFNFFINAYNCLNLLGLDKERNKKVVFSSFQNDAQHAFYASHCDYLVSNDEQLLIKARILYELFNIETRVLNFIEFETLINQNKKEEYNFKLFQEQLLDLFNSGEVVNDFNTEEQNKRVIVYRLKYKFFGFFNYLNLVIKNEENPVFIFYNESNNYSRFMSFIEFSKVTNKIISLLGPDNYSQEQFTEEDKKLIIENNWQGRAWRFQNDSYYLNIDDSEKKFVFYYIPDHKISEPT